MKEILQQLIPPLFLKVFKQSKAPPYKAYKSYKEALKDCPKEAYEDTDIVKVVVEKNIVLKKEIAKNKIFDLGALRTLIGVALAASDKKILRVIDFGGGGGYHYTITKTALSADITLLWNVVETAAMAKEARRMSNDELKFFDNIEGAQENLGEVDFVFTSGALHCCQEPLVFLRKLINIKAKYLFITRTSFINSEEEIANIQESYLSTNGPGPLPVGFTDKPVYYPNVFISKKKVEEMLCELYQIKFKILEDKAAYKVGDKEIDMYGYYCVIKN